MNNSSSHMTMAQDDAFDSKHGIKENSPRDMKLDMKLMGKRGSMSVPKYDSKSKSAPKPRQANLAQALEKLAGRK